MNKERLLKLAKFLENLDDKHFDFSLVAATKADTERINPLFESLDRSCGTVACAVGWMPAAFPGEMEWTTYGRMRDEDGRREMGVVMVGSKSAHASVSSAAEFLGISMDESCSLFNPYHPSCPLTAEAKRSEVVAHIRKFVKRHNTPDVIA